MKNTTETTIQIGHTDYIIVATNELGPRQQAYGWKDAILVRKPNGKIHWYANRTADGKLGTLVRI